MDATVPAKGLVVPPTGLTEAEVEERRRAGQGNAAGPATTRTYGQIGRPPLRQVAGSSR